MLYRVNVGSLRPNLYLKRTVTDVPNFKGSLQDISNQNVNIAIG